MVCGIVSSERGCKKGRGERTPCSRLGLLGCVHSGLRSVQPGPPATLGPQSAGPSLLAAQATSLPRPSVLSDETTTPDPQPRVAGSVLCLHFPGWSATARRPEPGAGALGHSPALVLLVLPGTRSVIQARKPSAISLSAPLRLPSCCPRIGAPRLLRTHTRGCSVLLCVPLLHSSFIWLLGLEVPPMLSSHSRVPSAAMSPVPAPVISRGHSRFRLR